MHLGFSEESKAYKLYDPMNKKVIVSRDVLFDESKSWNWDDKMQTQQVHPEDDIDEENLTTSEIEVLDEEHENNDEINDVQEETSEESENEHQEVTPRTRKPLVWSKNYVKNLEEIEDTELRNLAVYSSETHPATYEEAAKFDVWRKAMDQEIESIEKNNTWCLNELPNGSKKIGVKWIFKTKHNEAGKIEKYKARLVAKGYS